jgi:hypothetical protein
MVSKAKISVMIINKLNSVVVGARPIQHSASPATQGAVLQSAYRRGLSSASVTLRSGAQTTWHSNQLGELLIVNSGCGWIQYDDGVVESIKTGDVVWIMPDNKPWPGTANISVANPMALYESENDELAFWMGARIAG